MGRLELRLLGKPQVLHDGRDLAPVIESKGLALLGFLALSASDKVTREKLAGTLWCDKSEQAARYRLRHTLWELRKSLADEYIQSDNVHCWLDMHAGIWVDAREVQRGVSSVGIGSPRYAPCPEHIAQLKEMQALFRGELLQELRVQEAPLFEEWLMVERERWQLLYQDILWSLGRAQQAAQHYGEAAQTLSQLVDIDPLRERNYRALMGIHFDRGDRAAALLVYRQCAQILSSELGISPSPETERVRALVAGEEANPTDRQLKRAAELCKARRFADAWSACAAAEALGADPVTASQVALLRAEILLSQGKGVQSLSFVQAARKTLARALRG